MQTTRERELLCHAYSNIAASARAVLAGCAVGLGALAIMGGAGLLEEQDPIALADRIQNERARVAVSQTAAEHQRAVFVARQEQFDRRAARTMYASATGVTPGR